MKSLKYTTLLSLGVALTLGFQASAGETNNVNAFFGQLSIVTSAELPAKAAELVKQSAAKNLNQTTIEVVKASVGLNPAAASAIVGSIAQSSPTVAGLAAATAVALVPDQVVAIVRAAAAAAPTKAGSIVEAVCHVLPQDYQAVANAVAEIVPGADKEILAGIAAAIPELGNSINQTLAVYKGQFPSLSTVLTQVAQSPSGSASSAGWAGSVGPLPQGPSQAPPFVPISGTQSGQNPGSGDTESPTGPRGYHAP